MSTASASPADMRSDAGEPPRVRVWDLPVRVFHLLMIASFAGAWLTAESERWLLWHVAFGGAMAALVLFRVLWGLVGTRHARFADFVRGPAAVLHYARSVLAGRPQHTLGHNPAGGWAIVALLACAAVVLLTGWAAIEQVGGNAMEELHEGAAAFMLAIVVAHIGGVLVSSFVHRENLVRAMVDGHKRWSAREPETPSHPLVATLLVAICLGAGAGAWFAASGLPSDPASSRMPAVGSSAAEDEDDD